jgi:hypothetical protein
MLGSMKMLRRTGSRLTHSLKLFAPVLTSLLLTVQGKAAAVSNPVSLVVTNLRDHFSLAIPAGWKELPAEQVAALLEPNEKSAARGDGAYIYAPANTESLRPAALVTVSAMRYRRISETYLRMLANEDLRRMAVFDHVRGEGVLERDIHETEYDTNRHLLQVTLQRADPTLGRIREIDHVYYTETGSITLSVAARVEEFDTWTNAFNQVLASFSVAPEIQYKPRPPGDELQVARTAIRSRFSLLGIGMLASIIMAIVKWRSGRVMSDEI